MGIPIVAPAMSNMTVNATAPLELTPETLLHALTSFSSLWALLSMPAVRDGAKLFIFGGVIETARRLLSGTWTSFLEAFFLTAEFEDTDDVFMWMMFWLSKQPGWKTARSVRVSTSRYGQSGVSDLLPGEEEEGKPLDKKKLLSFTPLHNMSHRMWYKGTWLSITRTQAQGDMWSRKTEYLTIKMLTRNQDILNSLLLEAKRAYRADAEGRINIYVADQYNEWSIAGSRPKRPLSSVVLDKGIKEHLLADAKDFMANENWYAERGIPWRRGYLLHGCPGSGKTSLIHSLAGELNLDIYIISLSKKSLDDSTLNELISRLPSKSIALMEDIDAAFFRGLTREDSANATDPSANPSTPGSNTPGIPVPPNAVPTPATGVTLSGLLGAIDGVAAQEGRLLFATTNKYKALDPALIRPGRLDVHVNFEFASTWQIEELFRCFFPPSTQSEEEADETDTEAGDNDDEVTLVAGKTGSPPASPSRSTIALPAEASTPAPSAIFMVDVCAHCPSLSTAEVSRLARAFASRIPEREFSMATIQGLLMQYKTRPYLAVEEAGAWVEAERKKREERDGQKGDAKVEKAGEVEKKVEETKKKDEFDLDMVKQMAPSAWFWAFGVI